MSVGQWNVELFRWINDLGKQYEFMEPLFIFFAKYMIYIMIVALVFYWFKRTPRHRMMVISAAMTALLGEIVGKLVGTLHTNLQPFAELPDVNQLITKTVGNSFPSDHTMVCVAIGVTFGLFLGKRGIAWVLIAALVAISRVGVGVHYPADVIAGILIAIIVAVPTFVIISRSQAIKRLLTSIAKVEQKLLSAK